MWRTTGCRVTTRSTRKNTHKLFARSCVRVVHRARKAISVAASSTPTVFVDVTGATVPPRPALQRPVHTRTQARLGSSTEARLHTRGVTQYK